MYWESKRSVAASTDAVFRVIDDPVEFQRAVGADPEVQYLTDQRSGIGARFRSARVANGRRMTFEQEIIAYEPGALLRMQNVTHGVLWDSTFEVWASGPASTLTLTMTATTPNPLRRLLMLAISRTVQKAIDRDMDAAKVYIEQSAGAKSIQ
jgi:hypothetical protein